MNRFARLLFLFFVLSQSLAMAAPDYSELRPAIKDYAAQIVQIEYDAPTVLDAQGTVKLIGRWAAADDALADKFKAFATKNPEVMQGAMPPPLQEIKDKIARLNTIHAGLPGEIGELAKRYRPDPAIDNALFALGKSKKRVDHLGEPDTEEETANVLGDATPSDTPGDNSFSVSMDNSKAPGSAKQLQSALEQNPQDMRSLFYLALDYDQGRGVKKDDAKAAELMKKAAEQGYPDAQACMGRFYWYGLAGLPRDAHESLTWYEKSANQGNVEGMLMTANAYETGKGTTVDLQAAIKWLHKAADQGVALGDTELGRIYMAGNGVPRDTDEGIKWFRKAVDAGEKNAEFDLANCYYNGTGVTKDPVAAGDLLRKSAEHGFAKAQFNLAEDLLNGLGGMDKNETEAVAWMKKAAEQGVDRAEFNYGLKCMDGTGRPVDEAEGARWFQAAALQGLPRGENAFGYALARGTGVKQDKVEACKWYTLAMDQRVDEVARQTAEVNFQAIQAGMTPGEIQDARDRAAHFVPVPGYHPENPAMEAGEEAKQKARLAMPSTP